MQRKDREAANAYMREWNRRNREKVREAKRAYYLAHRKAVIAKVKKWRKNNAERRFAWAQDHYRKNKRAYRERRLRQQFGIGIADYDAAFKRQGGRCAICGARTVRQKGKKHFHVDHCHRTKRFRGLLCHFCNVGLGAFEDDPKRLRAAAEYLGKE